MRVPIEDFGNVGLFRLHCDAEGCGKRITLCYQGNAGEYCSKACRDRCDATRERKAATAKTGVTAKAKTAALGSGRRPLV